MSSPLIGTEEACQACIDDTCKRHCRECDEEIEEFVVKLLIETNDDYPVCTDCGYLMYKV